MKLIKKVRGVEGIIPLLRSNYFYKILKNHYKFRECFFSPIVLTLSKQVLGKSTSYDMKAIF